MNIKAIKKSRAKIPEFKGTCGDCDECCRTPIVMNFSELVEIRKKFGDHARHLDRHLCPWYDTKKKQCAVYSERPLICRVFGLEKGLLQCSHNPEQAKFDRMEFSPKVISRQYHQDVGIPKVIADHFPKEITKLNMMNNYKIFN